MSRRIVITGATGLLGRRLVRSLSLAGDTVVAISRDSRSAHRVLGDEVECFDWNHLAQPFPRRALEGASAVFHLMGENIGAGRWTRAKKEALRNSRIDSTRKLVEALPDEVTDFLCASAIGIYPGAGDAVWDDRDEVPKPDSFMTQLCWDWEQAAAQAAASGRRQACLRIGLVLGESGMLAPLVPLYRLGLGGPIGDGRQYVPWIHIDDAIAAFRFVLDNRDLEGPVNVVGPAPVRLEAFSRSLAQTLGRPHLFRVPEFAIRLALGEAAALVLSSYNIVATRLQQSGFTFHYGDHTEALDAVIRDEY